MACSFSTTSIICLFCNLAFVICKAQQWYYYLIISFVGEKNEVRDGSINGLLLCVEL